MRYVAPSFNNATSKQVPSAPPSTGFCPDFRQPAAVSAATSAAAWGRGARRRPSFGEAATSTPLTSNRRPAPWW